MHRATGGLPAVLAALTLRRRPALLLHLKERSVGVGTTGHTVSFDAGGAGELLVVDEHHGERRVELVSCEVAEVLVDALLCRGCRGHAD